MPFPHKKTHVYRKLSIAFVLITAVLGSTAQAQFSFTSSNYKPHGQPLAGDMNGDGIDDIVVMGPYDSGQVTVFVNHGDGKFTDLPPGYSAAGKPVRGGLGDFNEDGKLDVAVALISQRKVSILEGNGDGSLRAPVTYDVAEFPSSLAMRVYVNYNSTYTVQASTLDTAIALPVGTHRIKVVAWDRTGKSYDSVTVQVTVSGS